ncbi:MAG: carbonic anhydrase family protein [Chloroflexi bacterium]|nr:carbonic anhydrase family protein [Chloroflexota bacterium]
MFYRRIVLLFIVFVAGWVFVSCSSSQQEQPVEHPAAVHWGYEGEGAPEHWADLEADYAVCGTGVEQSPIDLTNASVEELTDITFNYEETAVNILNNGHTVQINYDEGSSIEVNGTIYNLLQFHFHAPSEHAFDGSLVAAEMHLVHQSADGAYAVIGVMIQEGAENAAFAPVWAHLPAEVAEAETIDDVTVNASELIADQLTYYSYSGSFTTPPCTEGVSWFVLTAPIEMSADQISAFSHIIDDNNRPLQPLGERLLTQDSD